MSTYENLHGRRVNVVSSNPSNPEAGEVWYNSTSGQLKGYVLGTASWTTGGSLNTKRSATVAGTVNAGLASFGYIYPPSSPEGGSYVTEEYNGTSWTAGGAMPTAKSHFAGNVGIQTAALATGGITPGASYAATTEEYGGESWTAGGSLVTGRITGGSAGTQTKAIYFGGTIGAGVPGYSDVTEGYD